MPWRGHHHVAGMSPRGYRHRKWSALVGLRLFSSWFAAFKPCWGVMLRTLFRQLTLESMEAVWITSIIPRGEGNTFRWFLEVYLVVLPHCSTTNSFKCLAFMTCSKWSLNTLQCSVVWPFSQWYMQYRLWFLLDRSPPILPGHQK